MKIMKYLTILLTLFISLNVESQTTKDTYSHFNRKILEENVGDENGILVSRTYSQREYSHIDVISKNAVVVSIALTRMDGSIELIIPTYENDGQIIGAELDDGKITMLSMTSDMKGYIVTGYSSKNGDISIVTRSHEFESGNYQSFDIIKGSKIIVKLWFDT